MLLPPPLCLFTPPPPTHTQTFFYPPTLLCAVFFLQKKCMHCVKISTFLFTMCAIIIHTIHYSLSINQLNINLTFFRQFYQFYSMLIAYCYLRHGVKNPRYIFANVFMHLFINLCIKQLKKKNFIAILGI